MLSATNTEVFRLLVTSLCEGEVRMRIYSPDLNPAEEVFSEVKSIMKQNNALFQVTRFLLATAFSMVTKEDCLKFITHSGYL